MLGQMLLLFVLLYALGVNMVGAIRSFMEQSVATLPEALRSQIPPNVMELTIATMSQMLPLFLISISFYYIVLTHWLGRKLLLRMGEEIPGMKPVREWMLPKAMVWYYLAALVMEYVFASEPGSLVSVLLLNLLPLLTMVFAVQAIAFLAFVREVKGWNRALPVIVFILAFLLPPLQSILALLGVFDVAFPLRERIETLNGRSRIRCRSCY